MTLCRQPRKANNLRKEEEREQDEGFSDDGQVHSDFGDDLQGRYGRIRDLKGARSGFGEEHETGLNEREGTFVN